MPDDDLAYLASLSSHPDRSGDTSNMNPDFAARLAAAIRQARAAGLPVSLMSGYRSDSTTGSAYDAGGNSSHGYGLASDIGGLDGPNGKITQQWAQIAEANGLHNPYGVDNKAEFNHWQLPPQPLEKTPALLAELKQARSSGDFQNVWAAYSGGSPIASNAPAPINPGLTVNSSPMASDHSQFITDYAKSIGLDPKLAVGIAGAEGLHSWSAGNPNAASTVDVENGKPFSFGDFQLNVRNGMGNQAVAAGIDPRDPKQWQAADKFALDQMKAGGVGPWKGDPVAAAYLKSGTIPNVAAPTATGTATAAATPTGPLGAFSSTVLPGFQTQGASDKFKTSLGAIDKAMGGQGLGDSGGGQQQTPQAPPMGPPPMARNVSPLGGAMLPQAAQLSQMLTGYQPTVYGQALNSISNPTAQGATGQAQPGAPMGMSLASLQQLQMMLGLEDGGNG